MDRAKKPDEPKPHEIDGVPTAEGLVAQGLAKRVHGRGGTYVTISPEGQRLIYEAMKSNAEKFRAGKLWRGTSGVHPGTVPQPGVPQLGA